MLLMAILTAVAYYELDKLLSSLNVILSSQEFWMYGASTWVVKESTY